MQRKAFKMYLLPGYEAEYLKRHDEIWPELVLLLKNHGISNYSIFLDPDTLILFAYLEAIDLQILDNLPSSPIMQKWWAFMGDIMKTNPDNSPLSDDLDPLFYMP